MAFNRWEPLTPRHYRLVHSCELRRNGVYVPCASFSSWQRQIGSANESRCPVILHWPQPKPSPISRGTGRYCIPASQAVTWSVFPTESAQKVAPLLCQSEHDWYVTLVVYSCGYPWCQSRPYWIMLEHHSWWGGCLIKDGLEQLWNGLWYLSKNFFP